MSSRDALLGRIRTALGRGPLDATSAAAIDERLGQPSRNLVPERAQGEPADLLARFIAMAEEASASVARAADPSEIPQKIADYLSGQNLPKALRRSPHALLDGIDWKSVPLLSVDTGPSDGNDLVGLSVALTGVAETGTLVMASGPQSPTTLNFLPDTHIVVLRRGDIVGGYEDAWDRLRNHMGTRRKMPRTVNFITGPSRSADIEQTLLLGAHGPRRLHVILLDDPA
jgi:L-lactate dehydrogenase complex protein LldG